MKEDAVSAVVAAMLILAVIVTFFAAWNAWYIPSMKAQAEISHIGNVEAGILKFSSDIEAAASLKRDMRLSEPVPLGGGDVLFDPVRSGGELKVRNGTEGYLRTSVSNGSPVMETTGRVYLSSFSYQPVNNFWQDQGYTWSSGIVNVTSGSVATPLRTTTMDTAEYSLAGALFAIDTDATCSRVNVYVVNITPSPGHTVASGNGNAVLALNSTVITLPFPNARVLNVTLNQRLPDGFRNTLLNTAERRLGDLSCPNMHVTFHAEGGAGINPEIGVEFDAIPNVTLYRKVTEIAVGAY